MKIVERARLSCQQAAALFSEASGGATLHSSGTPRSPRLASPSCPTPPGQSAGTRSGRRGSGEPRGPVTACLSTRNQAWPWYAVGIGTSTPTGATAFRKIKCQAMGGDAVPAIHVRQLGDCVLCAAWRHRQSTLGHTGMSLRARHLITLCNWLLPGDAAQVAAVLRGSVGWVTGSGKDADGTFGTVRVALPALRVLDRLNYLRSCWPWPGRPSGSGGGPLGVAGCRLMWCRTRAMPGAER